LHHSCHFTKLTIFRYLIKQVEELEDIKLYDEVKAKNEESIPFEMYLKNRKDKNA